MLVLFKVTFKLGLLFSVLDTGSAAQQLAHGPVTCLGLEALNQSGGLGSIPGKSWSANLMEGSKGENKG